MGQTRFQKIERDNLIPLSHNKKALSVGLHIIHEVTSPQAFSSLRKMGLQVAYNQNTFAVTDHIIATTGSIDGNEVIDQVMINALADNCLEFGITHYGTQNKKQGICHVVGPDTGLTRPNTTIFCGDSHTSTHGAFGAIAAGIGTSNVRDILATGALLNYTSPEQMKIEVTGKLASHLSAKDIILYLFHKLGSEWATGGAVFYTGEALRKLSMEERMTIANMTIEMGGRFGYFDVDDITLDWFREKRDFWHPRQLTDEVAEKWLAYNCDADAVFDKTETIDAGSIKQMVSFGLTLNDIVPIDSAFGNVANVHTSRKQYEAPSGTAMEGLPINGAFIGSCTNGRFSDFKAAAAILTQHGGKIKVPTALAVPGSMAVKQKLEQAGIDKVFKAAGFEWREPGCSSCLAMNPDKLVGRIASSTNRNFAGRQGPQSRTFLMSPQSVALAALEGKISNVEKFLVANH
ncbi:hypothetical protein COTS27_01678 [Spirochaetota bacterium]|nr:hypothetical protein COTS27_01678 [Spirochaetota bacterium]